MSEIEKKSGKDLRIGSDELSRQKTEIEVLEKRCQQAEEALQAIEERNRVLGDSAPFGIFTTDMKGRITRLNRRVREMLPWPSDQHPESMNIFEFQPLIHSGVSDDIRHCWQTKQSIIQDYSCI